LGAAVRARDGRGPRTVLERRVPAHFGRQRPLDVANAIEHGQITYAELRHLSPVIFGAAADDDAVAQGIVDRLADELAVMGVAIVRRLGMVRADPDVVLAGGVFEAADGAFEARIANGIHAVAPAARVARLHAMPVTGAVLLALDRRLGDGAEHALATARTRTELGAWRPA
jgi:N-acetylglucosamine kinase-like BadF-type ATPase